MIIQPILVGLSCVFLGSVTSCSTNNTKVPVMKKNAVEKAVASKSTAKKVTKKSAATPVRTIPLPASSSTIAKAKSLSKDKHGMPTYTKHSQRTRYVRTTAYSCKENEPGAYGSKNAAGTYLKYGNVRSAAADWSVYPLGTKFRVKGQPYTYVVDDYGSALVGTNTIDIYKPSLKSMNYWGTRKTEITIIQWGSYERSLALLKGRKGYSHCRKMYYGCKKKLSSNVASN